MDFFTDGSFAGLLIGIAICGLFAVMILISVNYSNKKKIQIRSTIPPLLLAEMNRVGFQPYPPNRNFMVGRSYIYDVVEEGNRFQIKLLFRHEPTTYAKTGDSFDSVYMDKQTFIQSGLRVGMLVNTLHNENPQYQMKVAQILL